MVMDTMQIRINEQLVKEMDKIVKSGFYANRADLIRDAVRRFIWDREVGRIKNNQKDSVKEIKELRKKLSNDPINLEEINNFGKL